MNFSDILFIIVIAIFLGVYLFIKKKNSEKESKNAHTKCRGCSNYSFCKRKKKGEKDNL